MDQSGGVLQRDRWHRPRRGIRFVVYRRRQPLLEVRLFADPAFATGAATIMVFFGANFGLFYLEMQYLQLVKDYSPMSTALAFSPLIAGVASLSALSFWYLPKLGRAIVNTCGSRSLMRLSGLS